MTLDQLAGMYRAIVGGVDSRGSMAFENIDYAHRKVVAEITAAVSGYFRRVHEFSVSPSPGFTSVEFALPADFLSLVRLDKVTSSGSEEMRMAGFDAAIRDAPNPYGDPVQRTDLAYLVPPRAIGVVRPTSTYTMRLFYDREPAPLISGEQIPETPPAHHYLLAEMAAARTLHLFGAPLPRDLERSIATGLGAVVVAADAAVNP